VALVKRSNQRAGADANPLFRRSGALQHGGGFARLSAKPLYARFDPNSEVESADADASQERPIPRVHHQP